MIRLYSTHCPRCRIVEMKLEQKKIEFEMVDDENKVVEVGKTHGIMQAPIMEVDGEFLNFNDAVKFINEQASEVAESCSSCNF